MTQSILGTLLRWNLNYIDEFFFLNLYRKEIKRLVMIVYKRLACGRNFVCVKFFIPASPFSGMLLMVLKLCYRDLFRFIIREIDLHSVATSHKISLVFTGWPKVLLMLQPNKIQLVLNQETRMVNKV